MVSIYSFTLFVLNSRCACFVSACWQLNTTFSYFSCSTTIYWTSIRDLWLANLWEGLVSVPTNQSWQEFRIHTARPGRNKCEIMSSRLPNGNQPSIAPGLRAPSQRTQQANWLRFFVLCKPFENMIVLPGNVTRSKTSVGKVESNASSRPNPNLSGAVVSFVQKGTRKQSQIQPKLLGALNPKLHFFSHRDLLCVASSSPNHSQALQITASVFSLSGILVEAPRRLRIKSHLPATGSRGNILLVQ